MDEDAERILAQAFRIARGLNDDGENGGPALRRSKSVILVTGFFPSDAEGIARGADDVRHGDRDLNPPDFGEGIVGAGAILWI